MARTFLATQYKEQDQVTGSWQMRRADDNIRVLKFSESENGTPVVDFKMTRMDALEFCEILKSLALSRGQENEGS